MINWIKYFYCVNTFLAMIFFYYVEVMSITNSKDYKLIFREKNNYAYLGIVLTKFRVTFFLNSMVKSWQRHRNYITTQWRVFGLVLNGTTVEQLLCSSIFSKSINWEYLKAIELRKYTQWQLSSEIFGYLCMDARHRIISILTYKKSILTLLKSTLSKNIGKIQKI